MLIYLTNIYRAPTTFWLWAGYQGAKGALDMSQAVSKYGALHIAK